jgi:hypothetical protein
LKKISGEMRWKKAPRRPSRHFSCPFPYPSSRGARRTPRREPSTREHPTQDSDTPSFVKKADDMTTGTDIVANERSGKDILDENLWPGFDKFKVVQVRFAHTSARDTP